MQDFGRTNQVVKLTDILYGSAYAMQKVEQEFLNETLLAEMYKILTKTWQHIRVDDIRKSFEKALNNKEFSEIDFKPTDVFVYISPLSFTEAFEFDGSLSENIADICKLVTDDMDTILVAIEYVRLLHDIVYGVITRNDILRILPELDVLQSEVRVSNDAKSVFFAGLWSFIFADNYIQAINRATSLGFDTSAVNAITGALAGTYFGIDVIGDNWKTVFNEVHGIQGADTNA